MSESHKELVSDLFDRVAPIFGETCGCFDYFGKKLVEYAALQSHERVLDVATGRGAILRPAASRIDPASGAIVGVDISQEMMNETQKRIPSWIELHQMDAENLAFPDASFDVIFCGFAIYFFSDIQKVFSHFQRILKPGGRIAISSFGKNSTITEWAQLRARALGATRSLRTFTFDQLDSIHNALLKAKFQQIQMFELVESFSFKNPEQWWNSLWTHGARYLLEQLSGDQLEILRQEALALAETHMPLTVPSRALFAIAKP